MIEQSNDTAKSIEYNLKLYQIAKELEGIKKEKEESRILEELDKSGSYEDLLKYRRGRSKH